MVHEETARELIDSGSTVLGSLLKEAFVHRNRMSQIQQEKEMEIELAKARNEARSREPARPEPEPEPEPERGVATVSHSFQHLKEQEDCSICRDLLEAIERADSETQVEALTEYGKLKHAVETGGSQEEIKAVLRESNTLQELLEDQMSA